MNRAVSLLACLALAFGAFLADASPEANARTAAGQFVPIAEMSGADGRAVVERCPSQNICLYKQLYYQGIVSAIPGFAQWCRPLARSFDNNVDGVVNNTTRSTAVFFDNANCTGQSWVIYPGTRSHWVTGGYAYSSVRIR